METVNTLGDNVDERAVGDDGPAERPRGRRRARAGALGAALVAAVAGLLVIAPAALADTAAPATTTPAVTAGNTATASPLTASTEALAAEAPAAAEAQTPAAGSSTGAPDRTPLLGTLPPATGRPGTPTPTPTDPPVTRPTIADPGDVTTATVRFNGSGTAGHAVQVSGPADTGCGTTVAADGSWACLATVRSGPQQVFTVTDRTDPALGSAAAPASDVVVPPVVTTAGATVGPVSGTGLAGARVAVAVAGSTGEASAIVGADGRWTVPLAATGAQDGQLTVTATQTASTAAGYRSDLRSAASAPQRVVLDRSAPAAPVVTAPVSGDRLTEATTTVSGTGEPAAVLTVYLDRAPVCRTTVGGDGTWRCTTSGPGATAGSHDLTATQQDAAGNFSPSSSVVRVVVAGDAVAGATASAGTPTPGRGTTPTRAGAGPGATAGPGTPVPDPAGTGTSTGAPSDGGAGTTGGPSAGHGGPGSGASRDWTGPAGDWTASTSFDRGVPTVQSSWSWPTAGTAAAVAVGFLVLVAAPLALVGAAARGRLRNPFVGLLGRNRPRSERRPGDEVLPTWAAVTLGVGIVAVTTLLGVGVSLEARYVRLALAVLVGSALLAAAVVLATRWAAGSDRALVGFRVSPWLVAVALVACAVTRAADCSPALVLGLVLVPVGRPGDGTGSLRLASTTANGVRVATARTTAVLVLAVTGWVLHSLTPETGFLPALTSEVATTLCVGGVGALVASLVPVPGTAGAVLLAHARTRYVALAAVSLALGTAVLSGPGTAGPAGTAATAVAVTCALGALATWWVLRRTAPVAAR
ncbi:MULTISPECIES: Ig-like domain-containing protein [unclassified Curtobacterium]|uniref:Ig-like domain-containing protein n=1 Tax=unclassified Curtobacterium TaxID=257496 RepID=UPI000AAD07C5|nr:MULTISPECIES: Ig-like domain-containing protein [unclassified Curtobacterium]WIA97658.1 Ig-like domain-containing protein [Curtobacterium sp. MCBA15_004]WIB00933.1 Ig-like domain-containing protein [Curtobacterium sp. MCBA15_012]